MSSLCGSETATGLEGKFHYKKPGSTRLEFVVRSEFFLFFFLACLHCLVSGYRCFLCWCRHNMETS